MRGEGEEEDEKRVGGREAYPNGLEHGAEAREILDTGVEDGYRGLEEGE